MEDIAVEYVKVREFNKALKTVIAVEGMKDKASLLIRIAEKYAEEGQQPSKNDIDVLYNIIHTTYPIDAFWENF